MLLQIGVIRLAVLAAPDGLISKTLYLPAPAKKGLDLDWDKKGSTGELIDGGERTRVLGYLPVLTVRWPLYDERLAQGYALGTSDGQRPSLEDLLVLLSMPTGMLKISPGPSAGGFVVDSVKVNPIGKEGAYYTGLQATFRARKALSARTLEAF